MTLLPGNLGMPDVRQKMLDVGVSPVDAQALLDTCAGDDRLRLVTMRMTGLPRVGDRVRIGRDAAMEVLIVVKTRGVIVRGEPRYWALVGLPIAVSSAEGGVRGL